MKSSTYVNIHSANTLYLVIGRLLKRNKKVFKKYAELWNKSKSLIECNSNDKPGKHEKDYMKIKFNSNDNLPVNKY